MINLIALGFSSCFILLGIAIIYANSGSTGLDGLYIITSISNISFNINDIYMSGVWYKSDYINFALLVFTIGFLFKVSAAPFHFWSPDVYDSIPTIVTCFVAIIAKISIFILLLQLVYYLDNKFSDISWTFSILISSFMSLIIGAVVGLTQFRIKRLLAYSTISHVGFLLLSLSICSVESVQAFLFYLVQYSVSNLNAFFILIAMGGFFNLYKSSSCLPFSLAQNREQEPELKDKYYSPVQYISQLRGYFYNNPFMSLSFAITFFSFGGIPPLIGFYAKQQVLSSALDKGYIFLAIVAIITSVISCTYYLNIIKEMFFYNSAKQESHLFSLATVRLTNVNISSFISLTISTITLIILLFIVENHKRLSMGAMLAQHIFST